MVARPIMVVAAAAPVQEPVAIEAAPASGALVAVMPGADLAAIVDTMLASDRIAAVLAADPYDPSEVEELVDRTPRGQLQTRTVRDYNQKIACMDEVSAYAAAIGVRRKHRESIAQCLDEMLMNGMYDASGGVKGQHDVLVTYACDDRRFTLSVRDPFGRLERATVVQYLYKCLHSEQQIDRKPGGAGLGLYMMANAATRLFFAVDPGRSTEATCVFDLDRRTRHVQVLGFFGTTSSGS